jgi:hypothetical protein
MHKNSTEKILVDKNVLHLTKNTKIRWKDLKDFQFQDDDIIEISYDEGYVSENNSWDAHFYAIVTRPTLETNEEHQRRLKRQEQQKDEMRKRRYESYLKLKEEFENEKQST